MRFGHWSLIKERKNGDDFFQTAVQHELSQLPDKPQGRAEKHNLEHRRSHHAELSRLVQSFGSSYAAIV
jgi:hypothetical protein